jgi:type I restriction enzyme, R subunit
MALLTRLLRADSTGLANPTVLVPTDRRDLDKQIFDTFHAVGIRAIHAMSVAGLVKLLGNDYGSVFTSTVQKFQDGDEPAAQAEDGTNGENEELDEALQATRHRRVREGKDFFMVEERNEHFGQHDADGVLLDPKWVELKREKVHFRVLSAKANFYVLVDEAHRSQYDFATPWRRVTRGRSGHWSRSTCRDGGVSMSCWRDQRSRSFCSC